MTRALIVIDLQLDYFTGPLPIRHPSPEASLDRVLQAIDVAEQHGIRVFMVSHENPAGAPALAAGSPGQELHPLIRDRQRDGWTHVTKRYASAFDETGLSDLLRESGVRTLTLAGYQINNCVLATAAAAAPNGFTAEVLSDATGAIGLANDAGFVPAQSLHETMLTLLHSNFAAVAPVDVWEAAVISRTDLPKSNLVASAQ